MNFIIPNDVNNDILYCQKTLRHYIHVHQMLAATLSTKNMLDDPRLAELQNEIVGIGRDQKRIVDRLRLHIENYFVFLEKQNLSIDRIKANANVANQLFQNLQMCYDKVEPINVKKRLSDNELIDRYIHNRVTTSGSAAANTISITERTNTFNRGTTSGSAAANTISITERTNTFNRGTTSVSAAAGAIKVVDCRKTEALEFPSGVVFQDKINVQQNSLLKPKYERLALHSQKNDSDEQLHLSSSSANLKRRRLNLRRVLQTKAENQTQNLDQNDKNVNKVGNSIPPAPVVNKTNDDDDDDVIFIEATPFENGKRKTTPTKTDIISNSPTSSSSGSSLSGDTFDKLDSLDDYTGKELFLKIFGLCTLTYRDHLLKKRSGRKRRSCTSTEKRDFHYGNIDILERQSVRRNKRVFLKSTPEARSIKTKSKRRQSDAVPSSVKPKSEIKSSSSSKDNNMKLCVLCLKNANSEKMLECESCSVYYHLGCHKSDIQSQRIKSQYCPDCLQKQQNARQKMMADLRRK